MLYAIIVIELYLNNELQIKTFQYISETYKTRCIVYKYV